MIGGTEALFTGGGYALGILNKLVDQGHEFKLKALDKDSKDRQKARGMQNKHVQFTRRIIAFIIVGGLVFLPVISLLHGSMVHVGYVEHHGILARLFFGDSSIDWKSVHGLVLSPTLEYLASAVIGFYFGSKTSR